MDDVYLIDDSTLDYAKGRYAVYDDNGNLAAQDDDLDEAIGEARAKGARIPALVDLEMARDDLIFLPTPFIVEIGGNH